MEGKHISVSTLNMFVITSSKPFVFLLLMIYYFILTQKHRIWKGSQEIKSNHPVKAGIKQILLMCDKQLK